MGLYIYTQICACKNICRYVDVYIYIYADVYIYMYAYTYINTYIDNVHYIDIVYTH
jgi:hypothetical protein